MSQSGTGLASRAKQLLVRVKPAAKALWGLCAPLIALMRRYWIGRTPPQRLALGLFVLVIASWACVKTWRVSSIAVHNLMVPEEFEITGEGESYRMFVADSDALRAQGVYQVTPQQEVSIMRPFAVVALFDRLVAGREYVPDVTITDAEGKLVRRVQLDGFKTDGPQGFVYQFIEPDRLKHRAGEWTFSLGFKDVGTVSSTFNVLPPNAAEAASLMRSEKAREHVYMAFANYWLGITERGETTFLTGTEPTPEQLAAEQAAQKQQLVEAEKKAKDAPIVDQAEYEQFMARIGHPVKKDQPKTNEPKVSAKIPLFIQMAKMRTRLSEGVVSDADKLNGITYRGAGAFTFSVFRLYHEEEGWTGWVDVDRPETDLELMVARAVQAANETFNIGPSVTSTPLTGGMRFEFYEQDGNWFVISDQGHVFVNGSPQGKKSFDQLKPATPVLLQSAVFQPDQSVLKELLAPGSSARDMAKALGDKARASPEVLKQQAVGTMSMLRGQNLSP